MTTTNGSVTRDQSGLGYNLGATIATSFVCGLLYTAIFTKARHMTQPTAVNIGISVGIVIATIVALTAIRHFTAKLANRGRWTFKFIVVALGVPFLAPEFAWLIAVGALVGIGLDLRAPRSLSRRQLGPTKAMRFSPRMAFTISTTYIVNQNIAPLSH